jgi:hypothetical protein
LLLLLLLLLLVLVLVLCFLWSGGGSLGEAEWEDCDDCVRLEREQVGSRAGGSPMTLALDDDDDFFRGRSSGR